MAARLEANALADRIFPRWCASLFALLPLCEVLYLPAGPQSLYAAALACALAGLLSAGAARLSGLASNRAVQVLLALAAVMLAIQRNIERNDLDAQLCRRFRGQVAGTVGNDIKHL